METGKEDPQELIPCPLDPVHMVQRKRMHYHIIKCQKNVDMRKFRKCPFNALHIVLLEEYEDHVRTCTGRAVVENEIIYHQRLQDPGVAQARGHLDIPQSNWVVPETTESWDDDDFTVVVGSSKAAPPPTRPVERPKVHSGPTRLPHTQPDVYKYSVGAQSAAPKLVMGRGRGRGRGLAKLITDSGRPGVRLPPREPSPSTSEAPTESESEHSLTVKEKRAKDIRKLQKMLRQIERIEEKQAAGGELNADQLDKLGRKADVLTRLQHLEGESDD